MIKPLFLFTRSICIQNMTCALDQKQNSNDYIIKNNYRAITLLKRITQKFDQRLFR